MGRCGYGAKYFVRDGRFPAPYPQRITRSAVSAASHSARWSVAADRQGALDPARFIDRLAELGYKAYPFDPVRAEALETEQAGFLLRCFGVAAFAAMNVMMLSVPVWSGNLTDMIPEQRDFFHWLSALIALPAAAYS